MFNTEIEFRSSLIFLAIDVVPNVYGTFVASDLGYDNVLRSMDNQGQPLLEDEREVQVLPTSGDRGHNISVNGR